MRSSSIKVEKLGKSENRLFSLVFFFSSDLAIFYYFEKRFFGLNMAWKDGSFDAYINIF